MEGCKVPDKVILSAVSEVEDGVHGLVHVGARGVHRHRDGTLPPGQEGLEVVEECEVSVCCVGDALVTVELPLGSDVVVQHPELVPGALTELPRFVETGDIPRDGELC